MSVSKAGKPPLLFLAHRTPYPPDKGDKIRSFNLLKGLAEVFDVYLGAFVDDEADWAYVKTLEQYCTKLKLVPRKPRYHKLLSLRGLLTGKPLSLEYYRSSAMQSWVDSVVAELGTAIPCFVFCSPMAQFIMRGPTVRPEVMPILDLVDVDSEKWRQYALESAWPISWVYQREARRLLAWERDAALAMHRTLLVSEEEAALFRELSGLGSDAVTFLRNGVDIDFFDPDRSYVDPFASDDEDAVNLVFTGAMDYRPNVDAVCWFAREVMPALRSEHGQINFWIVGGKPDSKVQALRSQPGVHVTGRVDDVRPYLAHATAAVAPMQIARGVQNKVLEAMSMSKAVLCSTDAARGICSESDEANGGAPVLFTCESAEDYVRQLTEILKASDVFSDSDSDSDLGTRARAFVAECFSWKHTSSQLVRDFDSSF